MEDVDYEKLAIELVRELRGRRSQSAFSRRLGYRSNAVYAWEAGRAFPTAAAFFRSLKRAGRDVDAALARFYRVPAERSDWLDLTTREGVARLLNDLRGRTSVVDLAGAAQRSRFAVARWLKGIAEPRLPDFLRLIECASLRLLDFLACFSDPAKLPSIASAWQTLENARRAVYELPWSAAVLRVIELEAYRALKRHEPGFIARWLQIPREEEERCVALLLESGQIKKERGRLIPGAALTVDTRRDPERSRQVKAWWADLARERLLRGVEGTFSYNLFSVSRADLERIQELHRAYFRELRRIVADSEPSECIALATVHLFELGPEAKGAG